MLLRGMSWCSATMLRAKASRIVGPSLVAKGKSFAKRHASLGTKDPHRFPLFARFGSAHQMSSLAPLNQDEKVATDAARGQGIEEEVVASAATPIRRICVVGSGPAGFYFARYLLREHPTVHVDLLDALPHPFGLVRTGVAPDHPEVKSVENDFEASVMESDGRLHFVGNVTVGVDIGLDELRKRYNAVVLACGAQSDRQMGISGENLAHSYSARKFVNWYNGHPDFIGALRLRFCVTFPTPFLNSLCSRLRNRCYSSQGA